MTLKRELRRSGNPPVLSIPSQVADMCGFEAGQVVEEEAVGRNSPRVTLSKAGDA
jgi:antitoxin component of MazEF toxin-antitoxin module